MSNLDIAERRLPQDGRIKLRYGAREIDFRVSILPTIFGEKAVLRILDKDALQLDLTQARLRPVEPREVQPRHQPALRHGADHRADRLRQDDHALLGHLTRSTRPSINIMTAEDPVEYDLKGVNQVQINEGVGGRSPRRCARSCGRTPTSSSSARRATSRPRRSRIRAALTGHLVFSTLHTNDCPSTVARLVDMGVPPFLCPRRCCSSWPSGSGARICKDCKEPYDADEDDLVPYGHVADRARARCTFYKGKGCQTCNFTGMKGRVAIYEVMPITEDLRTVILKNAPTGGDPRDGPEPGHEDPAPGGPHAR